jgi:undecaprenyl-diphosphatase
MPLYQVVVLAVIQALTEFLPVSSSAHLELAPWLLGWKDPGLAFDVGLHAGTLLAIVLYFFRDWLQIIAEGFGLRFGHDLELSRNPKLMWLIALGTIPIGLAGLAFGKRAENDWPSNHLLIGGMLVGIGILMWIGERVSKASKNMGGITAADGAIIGVAQALAIVPGTSRSGITIAAGLFRDFDNATAARYSFLLSAPAILAAVLKKAYDLHKTGGIPHEMRVPFALGFLVSGILGAVVIAYFLKFLRRHSLMPFVYYRIFLGIIVIALAVFRYHAE